MKILAHFPFLFFPVQVAYLVQFPFNHIHTLLRMQLYALLCPCAYYTALCSAIVVLIAQHFAVLKKNAIMLFAQHFAVLLLCLLHSSLQCYCYAYCTVLCSAIVMLIAQHFAMLLSVMRSQIALNQCV